MTVLKVLGGAAGLLVAALLAAGCNDTDTTNLDHYTPSGPPAVQQPQSDQGGTPLTHGNPGRDRFTPAPAQGPYYPRYTP